MVTIMTLSSWQADVVGHNLWLGRLYVQWCLQQTLWGFGVGLHCTIQCMSDSERCFPCCIACCQTSCMCSLPYS